MSKQTSYQQSEVKRVKSGTLAGYAILRDGNAEHIGTFFAEAIYLGAKLAFESNGIIEVGFTNFVIPGNPSNEDVRNAAVRLFSKFGPHTVEEAAGHLAFA